MSKIKLLESENKNLHSQISELKSRLNEKLGDSEKTIFSLKSEITGLKENVKDMMSDLKREKEEKERLIDSFNKEINDLKKMSQLETGNISKV